MPPVFGPRSPSSARLASRAAGQGDDVLAVAQREERQLVALQPLLDQHAPAGRAEALADEAVLHGVVGLGGRAAHGHALAGRKAVGLDHDPALGLGDGRVGGGQGVAHHRARGRHARRLHDRLCERLRALDARGRGGGPEAGDAGVGHPVGEAGSERRLRPHDDEVDGQPRRQFGHRLELGDRHVVERRNAADAGVPGRGVELGEAAATGPASMRAHARGRRIRRGGLAWFRVYMAGVSASRPRLRRSRRGTR